MKKLQGFTLVELVVVIIILGILAVTVAPKFINMQGDARLSTLQGIKGSINGANVMIYAKASMAGLKDGQGTVVINDNIKVITENGYLAATATNIAAALNLNAGINVTDEEAETAGNEWILTNPVSSGDSSQLSGTVTIRQVHAPASCNITYTSAKQGLIPIMSKLPEASSC